MSRLDKIALAVVCLLMLAIGSSATYVARDRQAGSAKAQYENARAEALVYAGDGLAGSIVTVEVGKGTYSFIIAEELAMPTSMRVIKTVYLLSADINDSRIVVDPQAEPVRLKKRMH